MGIFKLAWVGMISAALCGGAQAATNPLDASGSKHDNHAPIEVTSDELEVMQELNQAIFTGHVVAIQGEVRLKADKMTVHYDKKEGDAKAKAKPAKKSGSKDPSTSAIKKIDTDGNVFLSTPEETASGDDGIYDVEHQQIFLNNHVILTRGQNVLKGDHLVYNFDTGKSKLTTDGGTQSDGKPKERVRALFVPDKKPAE